MYVWIKTPPEKTLVQYRKIIKHHTFTLLLSVIVHSKTTEI
jgi:hypothetical protein